jgi:hypothetical protein
MFLPTSTHPNKKGLFHPYSEKEKCFISLIYIIKQKEKISKWPVGVGVSQPSRLFLMIQKKEY